MKHLLDRLQSLDVVVLDDSRSMRELLKTTLRNLWVRAPRECADVACAFEELGRQPPDLVIADWEMPAPDGLEFVRRLRAMPDPRLRCIPVLMVTAHTEQWRVNAARDAGVTEFLCKPITLAGLSNRIVAILERPRAFVRAGAFMGPDRRRRRGAHAGANRRAQDAQPDLTELHAAWGALRAGAPDAEARLFRAAHALKDAGASFGYPLVSGVAGSLCRVLERGHARHSASWVSVAAHVVTLDAILEARLSDNGGEAGRRLLLDLREGVADGAAALRGLLEPASS